MYANENPKDFDMIQVINIATELAYLLRVSRYTYQRFRGTEVFWVYNRCLKDMSLESGEKLAFQLLNTIL